jgi:hypothetical protein
MATFVGSAMLAWGGASPLAAQFKSLPVYGDAVVASTWTVWLDAGSGDNAVSGEAHDLGVRVGGGLGRVGLNVGVGLWDVTTGVAAQFGGMAGIRLTEDRGGPVSLSVLAGVGYARAGPDSTASSYVSAPVGFAIAFNGVRVGGHTVVPWIAPRAELDRLRLPNVSGDQGGVGASAGVRARLFGRVGIHGALDWLQLFERRTSGVTFTGGSRLTAGIGANILLARPRR